MKSSSVAMAVALLSCAAVFAAAPVRDGTVAGGGREAFAQPLPGLNDDERERFFHGRSLFRQNWVIAPAADSAAGLGPLYNQLSCIACHPKNGRGRAPDAGERMRSMLLRLSLPGVDEHGGPRPHPACCCRRGWRRRCSVSACSTPSTMTICWRARRCRNRMVCAVVSTVSGIRKRGAWRSAASV